MATSDSSHPLPLLPFMVIFVLAISLMLTGLFAFYPKYTWPVPIQNPPPEYAADLDLLQRAMTAAQEKRLTDEFELDLVSQRDRDEFVQFVQRLEALASIRYVRAQGNQRIYTICFTNGCFLAAIQQEPGYLPKLRI